MTAPCDQVVIHIGRPDACAPHRNMDKVLAFKAEHPTNSFIAVLWNEKDYEEVKAKMPEGLETYLWTDDAKLMSWLLDRLNDFVGAQIVSPRWYKCAAGHETPATYDKLIEKCGECAEPCTFEHPYKENVTAFAEVFKKVIDLANFDTRSGEHLMGAVNPFRNICLNMPYALGCEHAPAMNVKGAGKGKPALICAAGPSLEDAIPHLKRLEKDCLILAVGRSYKLLRRHDIRVDYTFSVEMFPWDGAIFEGLKKEDVGDTILVFAAVCAHETVKNWPGKRVCMWDAETAKMLDLKHDWIFGGNSVAHHILNYAVQILDCEPAILVGVDLAYTKPRTHAEGTFHNWPEAVTKYEKEYQQELWVPSNGHGELHPECHRAQVFLPGGKVCGVEVRSSPAYKNFCSLMEILVAKHGKEVRNASPSGQMISGALYLDLAEYNPGAAS